MLFGLRVTEPCSHAKRRLAGCWLAGLLAEGMEGPGKVTGGLYRVAAHRLPFAKSAPSPRLASTQVPPREGTQVKASASLGWATLDDPP